MGKGLGYPPWGNELNPGTHIVEGKNWVPKVVLWSSDLCTLSVVCRMGVHAHKQMKQYIASSKGRKHNWFQLRVVWNWCFWFRVSFPDLKFYYSSDGTALSEICKSSSHRVLVLGMVGQSIIELNSVTWLEYYLVYNISKQKVNTISKFPHSWECLEEKVIPLGEQSRLQ